MPPLKDLTGQKFGRLTVLERAEYDGKNKVIRYKCVCECGEERVVFRNSLATGQTQSCGCLNRDISRERATHGYTRNGKKTKEYLAINNIIARCTNPKNPMYKHYGGRGITVCDRWRNQPGTFVEDMGYRPSDKHSIERIDVNGNYEPSNCKWATATEQSRNQRPSCNNTTGVRGVSVHPNGKYRAGIHINRKRIHLGYFFTLEEATKARVEAEEKYWGGES